MSLVSWFENLRFRVLPPIGRRGAETLARSRIAENELTVVARHQPLARLSIYNRPKEPCWYVYCTPSCDENLTSLRGSRILLISKRNGSILYDGDAGDEG